jgi:transcriptional regulator with XRE-family HTH domain
MTRTSFKSFKQKALNQTGVRDAYDELAPAYRFRRELVALRQNAGLTQEQIAEKLKTNKSNISRLESVNTAISPKLSTIVDYAEAVGYDVKIDFVPKNKREHNKRLQRTAQKRSR